VIGPNPLRLHAFLFYSGAASIPDRQVSGGLLASADRPPFAANLRVASPTAPCLSWSRPCGLAGTTPQGQGQAGPAGAPAMEAKGRQRHDRLGPEHSRAGSESIAVFDIVTGVTGV